MVGQLALSLVLLVSGALLTRGPCDGAEHGPRLTTQAPISSLSFNLQMNGYDTDRAMALRDRAFQTLGALPGVTAVSTASRLPLAPDINMDAVNVPGITRRMMSGLPVDTRVGGRRLLRRGRHPDRRGPGFHRGRRRSAAQGRDRQRNDGATVLARRIGGRPPIYIDGSASRTRSSASRAITRFARSAKRRDPICTCRPARRARSGSSFARRRQPQLRCQCFARRLWNLEPDIVFTEDVPAQQVADDDGRADADRRDGARRVRRPGAALAAVGVYGVMAYSVSRRTREVGIRMALGAERGQVLRMVLGQGVRLAGAGIVLGAIASAGVGRLLESLLYGVSGFDPHRVRRGRRPAAVDRRRPRTWSRRSRRRELILCAHCGASRTRVGKRGPSAR